MKWLRPSFLRQRRWHFGLAAALLMGTSHSRADLRCTGYYPGWEQGSMTASAIDFSVLTHVIHFSAVPNADGTLNTTANSLSLAHAQDLVPQAHAAGRKALFCVGGANSQAGFQGATSPANLATFTANLVNLLTSRGYDGIDIDWEPLDPTDATQYTNLVNSLRAALNAINPRPMLTAALASPPTPAALIASVQDQFDQLNIMTYDMSGPYPGWVTWFNTPLFDGGYRFPSTDGLVPSADGVISSLVAAGVAPAKINIGIAFYGWIWSGGGGTTTGGVSLPRQTWTTVPTTSQASYNSIMATFYQTNLYHWDTAAQSAYLSIDNPGSNNDMFISYDDAHTCQTKVSYARNRQLGGIMIWEIGQDHQTGQPDPLLQAIKSALATPGPTSIRSSGQDIDLGFASLPLGSYRVQFATDLPPVVWNTLLVTNITGNGGNLHVTDSNALSRPIRVYRVQTPP